MSERVVVWLRPNRRALGAGAAGSGLMSVALLMGAWYTDVATARWLCVIAAAICGYLLGSFVFLYFRPRLAYADAHLMVYLRTGAPIRVPIEVVECFFLGQGPSLLSTVTSRSETVEQSATIVIRLAEAAEEWKHRDVTPKLGLWCDGYVTVRGTWCERITPEVLQRLNSLLVQAHRDQRGHTTEAIA